MVARNRRWSARRSGPGCPGAGPKASSWFSYSGEWCEVVRLVLSIVTIGEVEKGVPEAQGPVRAEEAPRACKRVASSAWAVRACFGPRSRICKAKTSRGSRVPLTCADLRPARGMPTRLIERGVDPDAWRELLSGRARSAPEKTGETCGASPGCSKGGQIQRIYSGG